jgi:hypothetical protein
MNIRRIIEASFAAITAWTSWHAVSWALVPGVFLWMDEIGSLTRLLNRADWLSIGILPKILYNDRPVGFVIARVLFDSLGFDYYRQLHWFLAIHAANLLLGFLLFRRLGIGRIAALAIVACYGMLSTTAQTATYIGTVFDVTCLLLLLCSILTFLGKSRWAQFSSVVFFFLTLRTKEIAIVLPVLLAILAFEPSLGLARGLRAVVLRLWPHLVIWIVFIVRYASLIPGSFTQAERTSAYHINATPPVIAASFSYYTRLVFGVEPSSTGYLVLAAVALLLVIGLAASNRTLVFAITGYLLLLLPVAIVPGIRAPFYLYAPQMFLLLALASTVEGLTRYLPERFRFWAVLGAAVCALLGALHFRESQYFTDRTAFMINVRTISARTASQVSPIMPLIAATNRLEIDSDGDVPWLFAQGPCDFIHVVTRSRECVCIIRTAPVTEIHHSDANQTVLRYAHDGSIVVEP